MQIYNSQLKQQTPTLMNNSKLSPQPNIQSMNLIHAIIGENHERLKTKRPKSKSIKNHINNQVIVPGLVNNGSFDQYKHYISDSIAKLMQKYPAM